MNWYRVFYAAKYIDNKQYQEDLSFEELQKWIVTDGDDEDSFSLKIIFIKVSYINY